LRVCSNAARSASISATSNCRWPPALRRGSGKPKRRSHERSVLGLTPSIAAAAFVRMAPMTRCIGPAAPPRNAGKERCSARRPAPGARG
jgi:hypothetical protein